ncbi:unnamed protein product [Penicillium camemberti]|uniref:Str. FM013 n=1 Tax=Penicillium camemberti (strain FM 013) TaxID=1429867 RepID=A0A0G4PTP1_PENC3|nr:unnamed protein product [Penicillium camemberti]
MATPSKNAVQAAINQCIDGLAEPLRMLNQKTRLYSINFMKHSSS